MRISFLFEGGAETPVFLSANVIKPFITEDLSVGLFQQILYQDKRSTMIGYDAKILPTICELWMKARDAGKIRPLQIPRVQKDELLLRGLAHIGIISLIDEATGYQQDRERDELHKLLEKYLSEERLAWTRGKERRGKAF